MKMKRIITVKPGKKDLFCALIAYPCLIITGFIISFLSKYTGGESAKYLITAPSSVLGWILTGLFCLIYAYIEELLFRFCLLSERVILKLTVTGALVLSTALFSICHLYEGYWGVLNALVSGLILGVLFLKFKSLHGVAIAHALYNITAYIINALSN